MADFVGLLKKTIEAQSQITPRLRQRVYERARTTVERKLSESQAPAPIIERQREVLQRAIDEVEAYYQTLDLLPDAANEEKFPLSTEEDADFVEAGDGRVAGSRETPGLASVSEVIDTRCDGVAQISASPSPPEAIAEILPELENASPRSETQRLHSPMVSEMSTPPPFEEAFAREEVDVQLSSSTRSETLPDASTPLQTREDGVVSDILLVDRSLPVCPPFPEEPLKHAEPDSASPELRDGLNQPIPSLSDFLDGDKAAPLPAALSVAPRTPFLSDDILPERQTQAKDTAVEMEQPASLEPFSSPMTPQMEVKPAAMKDDSLPDEREQGNLADEQMPSAMVQQNIDRTQGQESYPFTDGLLARLEFPDQIPIQEQGAILPEEEFTSSRLPLGDYLPLWSERDDVTRTSPFPVSSDALSPPAAFTPLPPDHFLGENAETEARSGGAEGKIDKALREIEALRSGEDRVGDELPFSSLDAPSLPGVPVETLSKTSGNTADFDQDLVSEIFAQAAIRKQKQSGKKRRLTALLIGVIVLVVLSAIVGVLLFTNEYQFARRGEHDSAGSGQQAVTEEDTVNGGRVELADALNPVKITRRLLPDGQENDPGPAIEALTPGEGSSQANAVLTHSDAPARAMFYEAPTDISAATANEGQVEWTLRRTPLSPDAALAFDAGRDEELSIVGDVKIPALDIALRLTLRRNYDDTVPADYLTEIIFVVPDDFEGEAIDDIGPLLFKASEQSTGQELVGTVNAKVRDNLFLVATRAPGPILDRNLALMRQLPWLKLNVLYKNGRVGEFSIAKGTGGDRIFKQVLDVWTNRANPFPSVDAGNENPAPVQDEQQGEPGADGASSADMPLSSEAITEEQAGRSFLNESQD